MEDVAVAQDGHGQHLVGERSKARPNYEGEGDLKEPGGQGRVDDEILVEESGRGGCLQERNEAGLSFL